MVDDNFYVEILEGRVLTFSELFSVRSCNETVYMYNELPALHYIVNDFRN